MMRAKNCCTVPTLFFFPQDSMNFGAAGDSEYEVRSFSILSHPFFLLSLRSFLDGPLVGRSNYVSHPFWDKTPLFL